MRTRFTALKSFVCLTMATLICVENHAAEPSLAEIKFFEQSVRPLLIEKCFECHSGDEHEGGLKLDSSTALGKGGDSGPIVVPGKPNESLLVSAIRYEGLEMPPDEPLDPSEKKIIERWIEQGAKWPEFGDENSDKSTDKDSTWWAAEPIKSTALPQDPIRRSPTMIDDFVDEKLAAINHHRAPRASRAELIRRLSYDLLGVPPTPEEIDRFAADDSPDAYRRLVEQMFADPRYGERMARLWLDLVRYADSDGWRQDAYRTSVWKYRQWVSDAFNQKMPYDRFVALQIAGDEIAPGDPSAAAAVGFYRLGIYEYNQRNAEGQWQDIVDELTDVTADVFLATGLACAKCHDHKFDPITRSDYYEFRSIFEPVVFIDERLNKTPTSDEQRKKIADLKEKLSEVEKSAAKELGESVVEKFPVHVQSWFNKPVSERTSYEHQIAYLVGRQYFEEGATAAKVEKKIGKERAAERKKILSELDKLGANPYASVSMMTIRDFPGEIRPTRLPGRTSGNAFTPGAPDLFKSPKFDSQAPADAPQSSGRRTALAEWITAADNPITARVIVNRLWQYHFGTGLVSSPNDFGRLGTTPSHPELLDNLSARLISSDWDLQSIQRSIVLSAVYLQSSIHPDANQLAEIDAGNRLLWHHAVQRLDAEQFRDSLLVAMGSIDSTYGGPSVSGTPPRRTIYLRRMRNSADEMLHLMDCPPGVVGTAKRDATITAPQTLMMINNSRILGVAKTFASRVRSETNPANKSDSHREFVRRAHRILTGQDPSNNTIQLLRGQNDTDICHILLNSNAFLFVE